MMSLADRITYENPEWFQAVVRYYFWYEIIPVAYEEHLTFESIWRQE